MRTLIAFTKKEYMEQVRSRKLLVLGIIFLILGLMNPLVAKLMPKIMEGMADQLAESGLTVGEIKVTALNSWEQFFKNISTGLIAFVLLESGLFTREYQSGTLVLSLTKGLKRYKVVLAKIFVLLTLWTAFFWMTFIITYVYNDFYWDNSEASHLFFSGICWWLFGAWVISIMVLVSTVSKSGSSVLLGTGGIVFFIYLLGMIPKVEKYLEIKLTEGLKLVNGQSVVSDYVPALIITLIVSDVFFIASIFIFNKKSI